MQLRAYQKDAIDRCRSEFKAGRKRVVLVIPTGGGKTLIGSEVVRLAVARKHRVLWLAHRTELIEQAAVALHRRGIHAGAIAASAAAPIDRTAPVQVASVQTLLARDIRPEAQLVVWDECHHASEGAAEWVKLLEAYPAAPVLGLTATPERGDGSGLAPLFDGLVVGETVRRLTMDGWLVPCDVFAPERMLESGQLAKHPLAAYQEHAPGSQAILFARSVEEAERYAEEFIKANVSARCIHAGTPEDDRRAALEAFRARALRVLTNVYVLTEGTDLPTAQTCILARGASTAGIYLQMVGRVLRPADGKGRAILLDLRGVSRLHGPPEDERVFSLEGRAIARALQTYCPVCGVLRQAGAACEGCGWQPDARDEAPSKIVESPLVKYARKIAEGPEQRAETLRRWMRQHMEQEVSVKRVWWKYKAVYGEPPPIDDWFRAHRDLGLPPPRKKAS